MSSVLALSWQQFGRESKYFSPGRVAMICHFHENGRSWQPFLRIHLEFYSQKRAANPQKLFKHVVPDIIRRNTLLTGYQILW